MKRTHDEMAELLRKNLNRKEELNRSAGADIFDFEFLDYDENDVLSAKCYIRDWQRNPFGNLQGGMLCYYMDATAGTLSWVTVDCEPVGTVDIKVDFIRAVPKETDYIIVKSKVISIGRRIIVASVQVYDPDGWLMATGITNTTRMLPPDPNPTIVKL